MGAQEKDAFIKRRLLLLIFLNIIGIIFFLFDAYSISIGTFAFINLCGGGSMPFVHLPFLVFLRGARLSAIFRLPVRFVAASNPWPHMPRRFDRQYRQYVVVVAYHQRIVRRNGRRSQ